MPGAVKSRRGYDSPRRREQAAETAAQQAQAHQAAKISGEPSPDSALVRVALDGTRAREVARYDMGKRIREVAQGPAGQLEEDVLEVGALDGQVAHLLAAFPGPLEHLEHVPVGAEGETLGGRLPVQYVIRDGASDYRGYAGQVTGEALDMVPADPPTRVRVWAAATRARSAMALPAFFCAKFTSVSAPSVSRTRSSRQRLSSRSSRPASSSSRSSPSTSPGSQTIGAGRTSFRNTFSRAAC